MKAKLYVILGAHPSRTAMLMLQHKGIEYETVEIPPGLQPFAMRLLGFKADPGFSESGGGWGTYNGLGYNGNFDYASAGTGSNTATWQIAPRQPSTIEIAIVSGMSGPRGFDRVAPPGKLLSCWSTNWPDRWISSQRTYARANTSPPCEVETGMNEKR